MRSDTILVRVGSIIRLGRYIDYVRLAVPDTFPSMVDSRRNDYQARIMLAYIDLVNITASRRIASFIIEYSFDHASNTGETVFLDFVKMPGFDDTRVNSSNVNLTESGEERIVPPHDFHHPASFIGNYLQRVNNQTMY